MKTEFRTVCPACQQPIEMPLAETSRPVSCPACQHFFTPLPPDPRPPGIRLSPEKIELVEKLRADELKQHIAKIRRNASVFTGLAAFFGFMATLMFVLALIAALARETSGPPSVVVGGLSGIALWLYLIAQIIHIRANTEK